MVVLINQLTGAAGAEAPPSHSGKDQSSRQAQHLLDDFPITPSVIDEVLEKAAEGFSSDEILINDRLRRAFIEAVASDAKMIIAGTNEKELMLRLLRFRKAGKLTYRASRRAGRIDSSLQPVAEIAARAVMDRHRVSSDTLLADPRLLEQLQREAELVAPGVNPYDIRRLILSLRKKRSLRPELVLQVADWERSITTLSIQQLRDRIADDSISTGPGVYLFRNTAGYLYVGEAANLASRLATHVHKSDRKSLAEFLASSSGEQVSVEIHSFPQGSPAAKVSVRRAYESELIRSRKPRMNVRP